MNKQKPDEIKKIMFSLSSETRKEDDKSEMKVKIILCLTFFS